MTQLNLPGPEGLDARIEYTLWYDDGNGGTETVEFDNLGGVEDFSKNKKIHKMERYVGNME